MSCVGETWDYFLGKNSENTLKRLDKNRQFQSDELKW